MFPTFAAFVEENDIGDDSKNQMVSAIIEHLASLEKKVFQYFSDQPETPFALVRNPFQVAVTDVPDSMQEEFIDLINDGTLKTEFSALPLTQFWIKCLETQPVLAKLVDNVSVQVRLLNTIVH